MYKNTLLLFRALEEEEFDAFYYLLNSEELYTLKGQSVIQHDKGKRTLTPKSHRYKELDVLTKRRNILFERLLCSKNRNGQTILHYSVQKSYYYAIDTVLNSFVYLNYLKIYNKEGIHFLNIQDRESGWTALHEYVEISYF